MIYTVRPGDTLAEIARRFGVSVATLLQLNEEIVNPNWIDVGQQIYIPDEVEPIEPIEPGEPVEPAEPVPPVPLPTPIGAQYALSRVNNLLLISLAGRRSYRPGETVTLYLIKINIGSTAISLSYPTTQRFDFTATANNQEWTWSRDRAFGFQQADLVIQPGECEVYTATWNQQSNNEMQMTGNTIITGWNVTNRLSDERLSFYINIG